MKQREITTDVLVIGAGLAGLRAAEMAKRYDLDVVIAEKSSGRTNLTSIAGGGFGVSIGGFSSANPTSLDTLFKGGVLGKGFGIKYGKDQRMEEINATRVIIQTGEESDLVIESPQVIKVNQQGMEVYQVVGSAEAFPH